MARNQPAEFSKNVKQGVSGPTQTKTMKGIKRAKQEAKCASYRTSYDKCKDDKCRKKYNDLLANCQGLS